MSRTFPLQRLTDSAASEAESAAASLGNLHRQLQKEEQKLKLLQQYHTDYQERLRHASTKGLTSAGLQNFNDFIRRLEHAIAQQRQTVAHAHQGAELGRGHWKTKQIKSQAFDTLALRFAAASTRIEAGREQKAQDDFASRSARIKSMGHR